MKQCVHCKCLWWVYFKRQSASTGFKNEFIRQLINTVYLTVLLLNEYSGLLAVIVAGGGATADSM